MNNRTHDDNKYRKKHNKFLIKNNPETVSIEQLNQLYATNYENVESFVNEFRHTKRELD